MMRIIKHFFAKLFGNSGYGNKDSFEELENVEFWTQFILEKVH